MNREQQKVLELLKEIDTICRKNKITYYLSPYLTLCAVTERPFPMNPASNDIYMKTGDMARFKNIFDEEPELRRTLESMENNSRFPGFFLRYTDKDTLFYKLDEYGKYKHPGLGINILPLQCEYGPKGKYLWNRMREEGWKRIYGKKASGGTGVSWDVSGWCESFPCADEAGWQRAYSGICSGSRRMAQKPMYSDILTRIFIFLRIFLKIPGRQCLKENPLWSREIQTAISPGPTAKIIEISQWKIMCPVRWWCAAH